MSVSSSIEFSRSSKPSLYITLHTTRLVLHLFFWRRDLDNVWKFPIHTPRSILYGLRIERPIKIELKVRFPNFIFKCKNSSFSYSARVNSAYIDKDTMRKNFLNCCNLLTYQHLLLASVVFSYQFQLQRISEFNRFVVIPDRTDHDKKLRLVVYAI